MHPSLGTIRQEDGIKKLTSSQAKEFFLLQMNHARGGSRGNTEGLQTLLDYVSTGIMSTKGVPDECPMCMDAPLHGLRPVFRCFTPLLALRINSPVSSYSRIQSLIF